MADALTPEDRDAMAGELALGLLDGEERAAALRRQLSDADFAAEVTAWADRLAPLFEAMPEAQAPEGLWPRIEARLGDRSVVDPAPLIARAHRWRSVAVGMGAIAASLALILGFQATRPVAPPLPQGAVVAQLIGEAGAPRFAARYEPGRSMLRVRADAMPAPGGKMPELWVIPADGTPRSLGMVVRPGMSEVAVPETYRALIADGATLAVTLEPMDGAPHSAPSSAPVSVGTITVI